MKWLPKVLIALVALLELCLFSRGVTEQVWRVRLAVSQGLGFKDPACTTGYCDYMMFWLAGHFVRLGQAGLVYQQAAYAAAAAQLFPYPAASFWPFLYPPMAFLPVVMISAMPLAAGYYLFSAVTLAACCAGLRRAGVPWWGVALGVVSPEAMWCVYLGQWGFLCGTVLLLGCALLERRPGLGGALLALLCMKPHYALLVPVIVLARGRYRAVLTGMMTCALLVSAGYWLGGSAGWASYWGAGRESAAAVLAEPAQGGPQTMWLSVFWMVRSLGAAAPLAYAVQAGVSAAAGLAAWRLWRPGGTADVRRLALTMCLALLATPYGHMDDLAAYAALLPAFWVRGQAWRNAALAVLWLAPAYAMHIAALTGVLITPLFISAAALLMWQIPGSPVENTTKSTPLSGTPHRPQAV
jgi:hypothetical protein